MSVIKIGIMIVAEKKINKYIYIPTNGLTHKYKEDF